MGKFKIKIKLSNILYFCLLLYFVSATAYRLGTGFDAIFSLISFFLVLLVSILYNSKIYLTPVLKWTILFWSYYLLSCFWASSVSDTMDYFSMSLQMIGVCLFMSKAIKNEIDIKAVLKLLLASLVYTSILIISRTPISMWGTERMGGMIGLNANDFGYIMSVGALFSLYFFHIDKEYDSKKGRIIHSILYITLIVLFSVLSLFSGSKKALFLLVVGVLLLEAFTKKGVKGFIYVVCSSTIIAVVFYLIFNVDSLYSVIGYRLEKTFHTVAGNANAVTTDRSLIEREFLIGEALKLFRLHPIIGYGGNNFRTYMGQNGQLKAYSHNNYVELLSTLGIIGFILYYSLYIYIIKNLIKILKREKQNTLAILFLILIIMFLVLDFGKVSYINQINIIIYCIIGMYISLKKKISNRYSVIINIRSKQN